MSQNPALNWSFIMLLTSEVVIESFTPGGGGGVEKGHSYFVSLVVMRKDLKVEFSLFSF
jgi:hypothetical protein